MASFLKHGTFPNDMIKFPMIMIKLSLKDLEIGECKFTSASLWKTHVWRTVLKIQENSWFLRYLIMYIKQLCC